MGHSAGSRRSGESDGRATSDGAGAAQGVDAPARTIRYHLLQLDRDGLTQRRSRRQGREITAAGREALASARVVEKLEFVAARVDDLGYRMTFDPRTGEGKIVANVTWIAACDLSRAMPALRAAFRARMGMGARVAIAREGETLAGMPIPPGRVGVGTVCSVVVNGWLMRRGIPVTSRFGGLLEIRDRQPTRFTALMEYRGTTLDPLELFIAAKMTRVSECARTGHGIVGASFREAPAAALYALREAREDLDRQGLGAILEIGRPNQPLLGIPVAEGRVGMVVMGGLNPIAAICESGIAAEVHSLCGLEEYSRFRPYPDALGRGAERIF
mgnify:CR=1 FL=1